jgi:ABC-type Fe3+-hydroxamate transport system substrate-binding protein
MYRCLLILIALVFAPSAVAYQRVVLLAPAAGDIFMQLGARDLVVGVTRSNDDFPAALKVGSHIKPNIELLKGLQPDLLVISSNRFFSEHMAAQLDADIIQYDPINLDGVLKEIRLLGRLLQRQKKAGQLIEQLQKIQGRIKPLQQQPKVVFEVTQSPFMIAGQRSIVNGIITAAGGRLIAPEQRKVTKFNVESVLFNHPDYYIYQVGPMNKSPTPPRERPNYARLKSEVIKVQQLDFSRATTKSFYLALELNQRFRQREY